MKTISEATVLAEQCGAQLELGLLSKLIFTEGELLSFVKEVARQAVSAINDDDGNASGSSMAENIWRQQCCSEIRTKFGL